MITRFDPLEPDEERNVAFDFSKNGGLVSVSAPTITVSVLSGTDATPGASLVGSPAVAGAVVMQRVRGRLDGVEYVIECRVSAASGIYTINSLLPVRVGPVASGLLPRYCSEAQFVARFGADELDDLLRYGSGYAAAENDSASMIDGYISVRYTLPLVYVPALVMGLTADIARFKLWDKRAPDEVRKRYEDALAMLKDIAKGLITLPPDAFGVRATVQSAFGGFADERLFTAVTLSRY